MDKEQLIFETSRGVRDSLEEYIGPLESKEDICFDTLDTLVSIVIEEKAAALEGQVQEQSNQHNLKELQNQLYTYVLAILDGRTYKGDTNILPDLIDRIIALEGKEQPQEQHNFIFNVSADLSQIDDIIQLAKMLRESQKAMRAY